MTLSIFLSFIFEKRNDNEKFEETFAYISETNGVRKIYQKTPFEGNLIYYGKCLLINSAEPSYFWSIYKLLYMGKLIFSHFIILFFIYLMRFTFSLKDEFRCGYLNYYFQNMKKNEKKLGFSLNDLLACSVVTLYW